MDNSKSQGILQRESPQYNNRSIAEANNFSELGPCAKEKCCGTTNFPLEHWSISIGTFTSTCSSLLVSYSSSWSSVVSRVSCDKGDWWLVCLIRYTVDGTCTPVECHASPSLFLGTLYVVLQQLHRERPSPVEEHSWPGIFQRQAKVPWWASLKTKLSPLA